MLAVVLGGAVTWALVRDPSYVARPPSTSAPQARPAAAAAALQSLAEALAAGDAEAAAALAPPGDTAAAASLRAVARNARALGISPRFRYVDETGGVAADGSWSAAVDATWRYDPDSGTAPAQTEVTVDLAPVGQDGAAVTGFGTPDAGRLPVWLSGPVVVERGPRILVVLAGDGALGRSRADHYRHLAEQAVVVVRRVLPDWRGRLVVEVPDSSAALDRALDAEPGHTRAIAAVTAPVDGSTETDSPVHVFVNPDVFDRLQPTGARVVLGHEAVHVATDAARSDLVPWLLEGFADYVALRDVDLPVTTTASQIIREVRRDGVPDALPGSAEFDTSTRHLGATYEGAWLACVLLADAGGEAALVSFYRDVSDGRPLAAALRDRFGLTEAALTRLWQQRLAGLADRQGG